MNFADRIKELSNMPDFKESWSYARSYFEIDQLLFKIKSDLIHCVRIGMREHKVFVKDYLCKELLAELRKEGFTDSDLYLEIKLVGSLDCITISW